MSKNYKYSINLSVKTFILIMFFSIINNFFTINLLSKEQESDTIFTNTVMVRLLKSLEPVTEYQWPPQIKISQDSSLNALTKMYYNPDTKKYAFNIMLTSGLLNRIIAGDENLLAFILSHEIAHIIQGHFKNYKQNNNLISAPLLHCDEFEADMFGMKTAIDGGYSYSKILSGLKKVIKYGSNINSFECMTKEHPSWSERLSHIDSLQKELWESLNTFKNGVSFLSLNKLDLAIHCFKYITKQFPGCYEAHSNLGYSYLMKYINEMDLDELRDLRIGYILTGFYYENAYTIEDQIRGMNTDLWWEALEELKFALKLRDDLTLTKANLALAYLLNPRKGNNMGESASIFAEAIELAEKDNTISDLQKAMIYNNAGQINILFPDKNYINSDYFAKAEDYSKRFADLNLTIEFIDYNETFNALTFNKAILLSQKIDETSKRKAVELLADFLKKSNMQSHWWEIGYENYEKICLSINIKPRNKDEFFKKPIKLFKPVFSLKVTNDNSIILSGNKDDLLKQFDKYTINQSTVIPRKNLRKLQIKDLGIVILASDYVFAIQLTKSVFPRIELESTEPGTLPTYLFVGMSKSEYEKIMTNEPFKEGITLFKSTDNLRYYPNIGLAVKFNNKTNIVDELIITQLPQK